MKTGIGIDSGFWRCSLVSSSFRRNARCMKRFTMPVDWMVSKQRSMPSSSKLWPAIWMPMSLQLAPVAYHEPPRTSFTRVPAFAPFVAVISDTGEKIATGNLSQRIPAATSEDELGKLASVLNSTFSRLDAAFAQQARFTADAAHDLRTPVTAVLMHAQNGLATTPLTDEQRESFGACQRAAQRMKRLIDSLLELARLDAGQEPLVLSQFWPRRPHSRTRALSFTGPWHVSESELLRPILFVSYPRDSR